MKTEVYQKENGKWTWKTDKEESQKEFPTEHAAQRNLLRALNRTRRNPIPPAKMKTE